MKLAKLIAKIVVVLAAIAGAVYVIATYGNQIVAWCKKILASLPSLPCCDCGCDCDCDCDGDCDCGDECCCGEECCGEECCCEEAAQEAAEEATEEAAEEADFEN